VIRVEQTVFYYDGNKRKLYLSLLCVYRRSSRRYFCNGKRTVMSVWWIVQVRCHDRDNKLQIGSSCERECDMQYRVSIRENLIVITSFRNFSCIVLHRHSDENFIKEKYSDLQLTEIIILYLFRPNDLKTIICWLIINVRF